MTAFKPMKPLKDYDSAARAHKVRILGWAAYGGVIFGMAGFFKAGLLGFVIGWVLGTAFIWVVVFLFSSGVGTAAATVYGGSGSSTPHKREYSFADSLVMKGQFNEAAAEYEESARLYPDDTEPRLRLARLLRDRMQNYERAAEWFKQVIAMEELDAGVEIATYRELAELYIHRLKQPERALPFLARLADKHPDTPGGTWARTELTEIKQQMQQQRDAQ